MSIPSKFEDFSLESVDPQFIVFEGLDGSGTTSQLHMLREWLIGHKVDVDCTFEPTNGPLGGQARLAINGRIDLDPVVLALTLAADRYDHLFNDINGILNSLNNQRWVLCDRYKLSSLAYQASQGIEVGWLVDVNKLAREPDITIFVDTPPDICIGRLAKRSSTRDLFDDIKRLEEIQNNYLRILQESRDNSQAQTGHWIIVDGNQEKEAVFNDIIDQLGVLFQN